MPGYLLLDFYSGATGLPGRFSEGFLLRRFHVHIEKALGRASRLEPLHFTLSSSHDLVGVLCAVVRP